MNKVFCRAVELSSTPCSAAEASEQIQAFLARVRLAPTWTLLWRLLDG